MDYVIAIDSGGTKTETLAVDASGHILYRDISKGCNIVDIGFDEAESRMLALLRRINEAMDEHAAALYAGFAGANYSKAFLKELFCEHSGVSRIRVENDANCIITGMLGVGADGCSLICGTGCSLIGRVNGEKVVHVGGKGVHIDAGGSGYEIGKEALRHAFRAWDRRGEATVLNELLEKRLGKPLIEGLSDIYADPKASIASLAPVVFEGHAMGDRICHRIIDEQSTRLAEMIWGAERVLQREFSVVMNGGIFKAYPLYAQMVIAKASPLAKMIVAEVPPVYGCVLEAFADAGHACDGAFKETFMADYQALKQR